MYHEPKAYSQVVMCDESDKWKVSMKEKIDSLHKNNNQVIVDEPKGKILVDCKWIYKHKKKIPKDKESKVESQIDYKKFHTESE